MSQSAIFDVQLIFADPEVLHAFLAHLTDALVNYICYQIDSGAQVRNQASILFHFVRCPVANSSWSPYVQTINTAGLIKRPSRDTTALILVFIVHQLGQLFELNYFLVLAEYPFLIK